MAMTVLGVALGVGGLLLDEHVTGDVTLPLSVASTPESARSVLSTVASATMTFAGIAFSVTLLVFQMSSSQYSPRVIHNLFRDGFNKRVIGLVIGTFAYCLVVLRSVHGSVEDGPGSVVPTASVTFAVLLGIGSVLALIAFIDHNAHRMDVSRILQDISGSTAERIGKWPEDPRPASDPRAPRPTAVPQGRATEVRADREGWVQQVHLPSLLDALPAGSSLELGVAPGRYVVEGALLGRVSPALPEPDAVEKAVIGAIALGGSRTVVQDPSYGLRQMVDVALRALSPGVNDPTTAQDALFHIAGTLRSMLLEPPGPHAVEGPDGRWVVIPTPSPEDLVGLAYDELRRSAATSPAVAGYFLDSLELALTVRHEGCDPSAVISLERQAPLLVAEAADAGMRAEDLAALAARVPAR
jgi:uncharacterized membrane protein